MSGRTLLALLIAPFVSGAIFGISVMSTVPVSQIPLDHRPEFLTQLGAGVVVGVLFELFFLLPLQFVLHRTRVGGQLLFICIGTLVWFLVSLGLLSLGKMDGAFETSVMFLVPGVVLVVAFGAIVRHGTKALYIETK